MAVIKGLSLRIRAKDSRIALVLSVLELEIAAPCCVSFHLPLSFSETKNLLSFWALKHQHLLWRRRYGELEIISVKVVPLTPM